MKAAPASPVKSLRAQVAALPVRIDTGGKPWVLLVTSRETKRWVIPKGWPMSGRKPWEAAAIEALEEAGVVGKPQRKPIGSYVYFKRQTAHFDVCRVEVYLLMFAKQLKTWREIGQRDTRWVSPDQAADLVEEPGLVALIHSLTAKGLGKMKPKRVAEAAVLRRPPRRAS
jgi:8-oxo-dGTP pyrophosphatase MutT (NUDIX family)